MDEIYFHISRHLENLQIYLTSCLHHGRHLAISFGEELSVQVQQIFNQSWAEQLRKVFQGFGNLVRDVSRRCSTVLAQPKEMYSHLAELASVEMPVLYPGSAGFVLGAAVGLFLGLSWNQNVIPGQRMKAVVCMAYDGLDALSCVDDAIIPTLKKPQQILVQVKSASVDIVDIKICCGYGRSLRRLFNSKAKSELPIILGRDCSGVIVEIGPKVNKFEIGDEVWLVSPFWSSGTLAEYVLTSESMVSKKPKHLGFEQASSIPYAGCLAYSACLKAGIIDNPDDKKRVLIFSGVSPVGCLICQIAKHYNCEVTVTCTARADPYARVLKADKVIVYGNIEMENQLSQDRFDVVVNTVGGVGYESCLKLCKNDGVVVSTVPEHVFNDDYKFPLSVYNAFYIRIKCFFKKIVGSTSEWNGVDFSGETLERLRVLSETGILQPLIDKVFEPHNAVRALQHCDSVDAIGRTVIRFRYQAMTHEVFGQMIVPNKTYFCALVACIPKFVKCLLQTFVNKFQ